MAFGLLSKTVREKFLSTLDAMGFPMLPTPMNPTESAITVSLKVRSCEAGRITHPEGGTDETWRQRTHLPCCCATARGVEAGLTPDPRVPVLGAAGGRAAEEAVGSRGHGQHHAKPRSPADHLIVRIGGLSQWVALDPG